MLEGLLLLKTLGEDPRHRQVADVALGNDHLVALALGPIEAEDQGSVAVVDLGGLDDLAPTQNVVDVGARLRLRGHGGIEIAPPAVGFTGDLLGNLFGLGTSLEDHPVDLAL